MSIRVKEICTVSTKHQIPNTKQAQNTKIQMTKTRVYEHLASRIKHRNHVKISQSYQVN